MKTRQQVIAAVCQRLGIAHETLIEAAANRVLDDPVFYKGGKQFLELGEMIGKAVNVPTPDPRIGDSWEHAFVGTVRNIISRKGQTHFATVVDQDDNGFSVEAFRLQLAEVQPKKTDQNSRRRRFHVEARFWDGDDCYGIERYEVAASNGREADRRAYQLANSSPYADTRIDYVVTCVVLREEEELCPTGSA
jgi:hypothetical protein